MNEALVLEDPAMRDLVRLVSIRRTVDEMKIQFEECYLNTPDWPTARDAANCIKQQTQIVMAGLLTHVYSTKDGKDRITNLDSFRSGNLHKLQKSLYSARKLVKLEKMIAAAQQDHNINCAGNVFDFAVHKPLEELVSEWTKAFDRWEIESGG